MSTAARFLAPFALAIAWVAACTSASTQPPELGNCVKVGDASCADPNTGGGGGGPSSGEGGASSSGSSSGANGCGTVVVSSQNLDCAPCIDGTLEGGSTNCCGAAAACGNDCQTLLSCIAICQSGDTTCVGTCENNTPTGVGAYNDFASCISQNCTPECPTLQQ